MALSASLEDEHTANIRVPSHYIRTRLSSCRFAPTIHSFLPVDLGLASPASCKTRIHIREAGQNSRVASSASPLSCGPAARCLLVQFYLLVRVRCGGAGLLPSHGMVAIKNNDVLCSQSSWPAQGQEKPKIDATIGLLAWEFQSHQSQTSTAPPRITHCDPSRLSLSSILRINSPTSTRGDPSDQTFLMRSSLAPSATVWPFLRTFASIWNDSNLQAPYTGLSMSLEANPIYRRGNWTIHISTKSGING